MQNPPPVPSLLAELAEFITSLLQLLSASEIQWRQRPSSAAWSLVEIICHLRDVELEVHQPRFEAMIETENPFLSGVDADEWAQPRQYIEQDGTTALHEFAAARQQTITLLETIPDNFWLREARHAFFGQTTLHELLYLVVQHDRVHWEQVQLTLKQVSG